MKEKIIVILLLIMVLQVNAGVHFVSKTGSGVPPFATWATAADRIQKAIDIAKRGDTVYVANGVYEDTVRMTPCISLIGGGMDSCIIDTRKLVRLTDFYAVVIDDSCLFSGFHLIVTDTSYCNISGPLGCGIVTPFHKTTGSLITYNRISNAAYALYIYDAETIIKHNIISPGTMGQGITLSASTYWLLPLIDSNYFYTDSYAISVSFGTRPTISHNIFSLKGQFGNAFSGGAADTMKFLNNIIISESNDFCIDNIDRPTYTTNNTIICKNNYGVGIGIENKNYITNNTIINGAYGIYSGGSPIVKYNNSWNNKTNYYGVRPDSTNISVDPMFVNADGLDFHLQKYSPLIDAGDPSIKDVDGTRSDIGAYGGPRGEKYVYPDLPPKPPANFSVSFDEKKITLKWDKNTEADFSHYTVYRDTVKNFIPDSSKIIAQLKGTIFVDGLNPSKNYYYKICATDNQENRSEPGKETGVITGVNNKPEITGNEYRLYQNYPNPFNPSTKISYWLKKAGYVKINVYDIKGALVEVLENGYKTAGNNQVEFTAIKKNSTDWIESIASGIYLYSIEVKDENNIPIFREIKKMIMVK